jgi:chromosomal replication initiator protein
MEDFPLNHFLKLDSSNQKQLNSFNDLKHEHKENLRFEPQDNNPSSNPIFDENDINEFLQQFLKNLSNNIPQEIFNSYFGADFKIINLDLSTVIFSCQNPVVKKIITKSFANILEQTVKNVFGNHYNYSFEIPQSFGNTNSNNIRNHNPKPSFKINTDTNQNKPIDANSENYQYTKAESVNKNKFKLPSNFLPTSQDIKEEVASTVIKHQKNIKHHHIIDTTKNFNNFIVGTSNNMAHAYALSVAKEPGVLYPALYLYGNSGLGKTHLLHSICNYILERSPKTKITFTSANALFADVVESTKQNTKFELQRKYVDHSDILIIDDIHELKNKSATQEEFFHIFNQLHSKGKQLIFTSDKLPKNIDGIAERILSRLSSALVIEIQKPDFETRVAILKKKAIENDIYLDDEIINIIANSIRTNIRELEGALVKLVAYSKHLNIDIDLEIAKNQLKLEEHNEQMELTIEKVARIVANYYKVAIGDIKGKSRLKKVARARHVSMYLTHEFVKPTLEAIGAYYDHRDHSTVIHAIRSIEQIIKVDEDLVKELYEIESNF